MLLVTVKLDNGVANADSKHETLSIQVVLTLKQQTVAEFSRHVIEELVPHSWLSPIYHFFGGTSLCIDYGLEQTTILHHQNHNQNQKDSTKVVSVCMEIINNNNNNNFYSTNPTHQRTLCGSNQSMYALMRAVTKKSSENHVVVWIRPTTLVQWRSLQDPQFKDHCETNPYSRFINVSNYGYQPIQQKVVLPAVDVSEQISTSLTKPNVEIPTSASLIPTATRIKKKQQPVHFSDKAPFIQSPRLTKEELTILAKVFLEEDDEQQEEHSQRELTKDERIILAQVFLEGVKKRKRTAKKKRPGVISTRL
jgi:hypothetical protein